VHLKGTAVAAGSAVPGEDAAWAAASAAGDGSQGAGGRLWGLQQEQQQLEAWLAAQCRDTQVCAEGWFVCVGWFRRLVCINWLVQNGGV
jgi:hypothetical protein